MSVGKPDAIAIYLHVKQLPDEGIVTFWCQFGSRECGLGSECGERGLTEADIKLSPEDTRLPAVTLFVNSGRCC